MQTRMYAGSISNGTLCIIDALEMMILFRYGFVSTLRLFTEASEALRALKASEASEASKRIGRTQNSDPIELHRRWVRLGANERWNITDPDLLAIIEYYQNYLAEQGIQPLPEQVQQRAA